MSAFGKCNGGGRRRAARGEFSCIVNYRTLLRTDKALLVDVSSNGARLEGQDLPRVGEDLVLNIDGRSIFATVAWSDEDHCGVNFDDPLPVAILAAIADKVNRSRGLSPQLMAALDDWQGGVAR